MRGFRFLTFTVVLSLILPCVARTAQAQRQVTLGNSTAVLGGLWKFHTGDNMAWAQPGFNDAAWGTMDLTPPKGSYDPTLGTSGFVPGWTTRGYKGYHGYAWYRLRVNIENGQSALALKMPDNFDDAYQIYVNGQMIGEFGRFTAGGVTAYNALPRAFPLPANFRGGPVTIAIRMWMSAFTPLVDPDVGGLHGPPVLGQSAAIAALLQLDWDANDRSTYGHFFEFAILLLALLVTLGLFWLDRKEPAYLWLGITCAVMLANLVTVLSADFIPLINGNLGFVLEDAVLTPLTVGLWVLFWAYWFRLGGMARLHRAVWGLVVALAVATAMLRAPLYGTVVPVHAVVWLSPLTLALKLLLGILLIWVTVRGIRKDKAEGWLALPAILLVILSQYQEQLAVLHLPAEFHPFGIGISLVGASIILSLIIITVLLLRRFLRGQRERAQFRHEMEQARGVQQVLIPEALPAIPGFTLESEYRPAQQVGGDFFQIIAHPSDGSVLIVLGDVTGHGLEAAMLVSLIVGAIRSTAQFDPDPLSMVQSLNRRLLGRSHANATCLALRIAPDGEVMLANAGHLPPYLNGKEMTMEGALPLGVMEGAEFPVLQFQLQPGDRLTLLTDGVVEAQNEKNELFGFARTNELMRKDKSAAEIAAVAQAFGQRDDITVVTIERTGAPVLAAV